MKISAERHERQDTDDECGVFLRPECAFELRRVALRELRLGNDPPHVGDDGRHVTLAVAVGMHDDAPLPILALDLIGTVALFHLGQQAQRHEALRCGDEQVLQPRGRTVLVGNAHHDIEAAVAFDDLRDDAATRKSFQGLGQGGRRDAIERRPLVVGGHLQLRDEHLLLDLQVDETGNRLQSRRAGARRMRAVCRGPRQIS